MPSRTLLDKLTEAFAGRQLFLVGGALRGELLGEAGGDLDLATDARPGEIRRRIRDWADAVWLVGESFGTVGLQWHGVKAEITTFRTDEYDRTSRKPRVTFGTDVMEDLARRDFTMNAIARNLHTGELLDPFGGREDLEDHLVRFVGDPAVRIAEDPLRMLRAVRFCAQLGFELDSYALGGIAEHAAELRRISWERIRDELDRILVSPHPKEGIVLLCDLGLVDYVLPELRDLQLPEPVRYQMKDLFEHTVDTVAAAPPDRVIRYAALLHDIAKPETFSSDEAGVHFYRHEEIGAETARHILTRLRHSSAFVDEATRLIRHHLRVPAYRAEWTQSAVRRLMFDLGEDLEAAIALADADVRATEPSDYEEFRARMEELRRRIQEIGEAAELARMRPLLDGNEIMELLGITPGPRVGAVIQFLLDEQIEGRITTKAEAREAVRREFGEATQ
jgi:poly(A) polymerase